MRPTVLSVPWHGDALDAYSPLIYIPLSREWVYPWLLLLLLLVVHAYSWICETKRQYAICSGLHEFRFTDLWRGSGCLYENEFAGASCVPYMSPTYFLILFPTAICILYHQFFLSVEDCRDSWMSIADKFGGKTRSLMNIDRLTGCSSWAGFLYTLWLTTSMQWISFVYCEIYWEHLPIHRY